MLLAAFVFYAARLAPPDTGYDVSFVQLMRGQGAASNPAIFAAFNLLGVLPLMYWGLLFSDGRRQRVWAWPFALAMMAAGSFALLPYLVLRRPAAGTVLRRSNIVTRWFGSQPFGICVALILVGLLIYGIGWGDFADYARWFRRSNFINTMSVDFVLLTLLFPALLSDDFARRGLKEDAPLARAALAIPLMGPALYLAARPREITNHAV